MALVNDSFISTFSGKQLVTVFSNIVGGITSASFNDPGESDKIYLIINENSAPGKESYITIHLADSTMRHIYDISMRNTASALINRMDDLENRVNAIQK